jgi:zinc transporter 1/2/3
MLGSGQAALTATGAAVLVVNVTWKSVWQDPGATAVDAVDGDLTSSIQSFGAGAVDTSVPTAPGKDFSYVVEYYVEDKSKNAAPVARRLIRIACPSPENYCIHPETGNPTCTSFGACGASALLTVSSTQAATSSATTSSTSTSRTANASSATAATLLPTPPTITLAVPGAVRITAGDVYDRCADSASITDVCERGATADDTKDGNLDRQVLICGNR